jgi:hypothetical protein
MNAIYFIAQNNETQARPPLLNALRQLAEVTSKLAE